MSTFVLLLFCGKITLVGWFEMPLFIKRGILSFIQFYTMGKPGRCWSDFS